MKRSNLTYLKLALCLLFIAVIAGGSKFYYLDKIEHKISHKNEHLKEQIWEQLEREVDYGY